MSIKHWIAKKLAPSVFRQADRYERMRREVEMDRWWLASDFPEVKAFADRVLVNDANHWRALHEPAKEMRWDWEIGRFREQLRRGEAKTSPAPNPHPYRH